MSQQESMGAIEAATEGLKEAVKAYAPGLTLSNILSDVGSELSRMGVQGSAELAAALFQNNAACVPYGRGQNPTDPSNDVEPQVAPPELERGGR